MKYPEHNYKHSELSKTIVGEAYYAHNTLGSGFLEKVYERYLCKRLRDKGVFVECQDPVKIYFEEELVGKYFADIIVSNQVIVELKAGGILQPVHEIQLVNYLKATQIEVGLLINFGESVQVRRKVFSNHKKNHLHK